MSLTSMSASTSPVSPAHLHLSQSNSVSFAKVLCSTRHSLHTENSNKNIQMHYYASSTLFLDKILKLFTYTCLSTTNHC